MAIHNHQPAGNFGWVFEDVYRTAYEPFVNLLLRHPTIRLGLHYSGALLQWLERERPEFLDQLRALVAREQVEILGGGWYEPILASLPERDRIGQLDRMADELEGLFGRRPRGAWLAERVWEPSLPTCLVDAGYEWTIVDDIHLRAAAIPDAEHWGTWSTDDQGRRITVFGTEEGLRYLIPFRPVRDVIARLREHATPNGLRVGMMGDDGEKFGAWPTTWEHCWGRGRWMETFVEALEANASWLTTVRPSDWTAVHPPLGRAYLPTSSYVEMTEWALPPDDALLFHETLAMAQAEGQPEAKFLRGGFWRNFQRRYREINDLHKHMLRVSDKVESMPAGIEQVRARDFLAQGQTNDPYWHGLFGGIYLSDLRLAAYRGLIAAEDLADDLAIDVGRPATEGRLLDVDADGIDEVMFEGPGQVVVISPHAGAAVGSWDVRASRHALAAVLRRRPEAYHGKVAQVAREAADEAEAARVSAAADARPDHDVLSIHEIEAIEPGFEQLLVYDAFERRSGLVHLYDVSVTLDDIRSMRAHERADTVDAPFVVESLTDDELVAWRNAAATAPDLSGPAQPIRLVKNYRLGGPRLRPLLSLFVRLENGSDRALIGRLAVEWNLMMLGGGGNPAAWYEVDGARQPHDGTGQLAGSIGIRSGNTDLRVTLATTVSPPADIWWYPIETISHSESGFERVYQGSSLLLSWLIDVAPGSAVDVEIHQAVEAEIDHAAEDGA